MATTESRTKTSGARKYVEFDEFIDYQVRKTRAGIRSTDLLTSLVVLALAVTSYLLVFVVVDHWVVTGGIGYWPRVIALTVLATFIVGWAGWKILVPYLRQVSALFAAREIEQAQPELKSSLLTLIDLKRAGRAISPHIVAAMEKRAATKLSATDIEQAVDRRLLMQLSYALLAVVAVMCAYTVLSPKSISSSVLRALLPSSSLTVSTRTRIEAVDPGDAEVLARSQLEVTVDLAGEIPETATLLFSSADRSFVDEPITLRDTGEDLNRFRGVLAGPNGRGLLQNLTYRIVAGDAESRDYQVTVTQAPYATVTEVFIDYPDYMRLDDKTQPGGDIDAWEGTTVTVRAETNMPVAAGTIERSNADDRTLGSDTLDMRVVDETHLEATWKLQFDEGVPYRFYRIEVKTDAGATDPRPRFYSVNIRRDIPPEVRILHPTGDVELPANGTLPVAYEALDPDFMLRHVRMEFEQVGEDPGKFAHRRRSLFESPPERSSVNGIADVRLSEFDLEPGDVLSLWLEARDNQAPLGTEDGNTTRTSRINITVLDPVSRDEAERQLEQQREQLRQDLQQQPNEGEDTAEQSTEGTGEQPADGDAEGMTDDGTQAEAESGEGGEESDTGQRTPGNETATSERSDATDGNEQASADGERAPGDERTADETETGGERAADAQGSEQDGQRGEAGEDDALQRLFEEYRDEIEQAQREREQQQQDGNQETEGQPEGADQTGEGPQSPDADGPGGESPQSPTDSQSGGADQSSGDSAGTGRQPSDSETSTGGATGGEQRPSEDPDGEARPGDVDDGQEGTPTDDEGSARPQRATGDEQGPARPETDPDADPTPAQQPMEREGGGDPATRPTETPSDTSAEGSPQNTGGGERPEGAQPAPDTDGQPSDSPGDRGSSQSGMPEADRPPARSDQQPSGPDQSDPAPGRPDGQRSEQPSTGEQGSSQQTSEGTQGGSQQGPGDATTSPGSQTDAAGQPGGQPGDQPGEGSTSQPGGNQPGGEGMSGEGGEGAGEGGESGGQGGEGGEGAQGGGEGGEGAEGEGGSAAGDGGSSEGGEVSGEGGSGTSAQSGGGGRGGSEDSQAPTGTGRGGGGGAAGPDTPNLEDKRRASELVLERLKDQLERGEAPEELLDDLGWTEDKLRDFMGRLEQRLADSGADTSPEAQARRRQFETILEGIDYASEGQQREGGDGPREAAEGFGNQRRPVPPEYRELQNEYRRRLSRQTRGE